MRSRGPLAPTARAPGSALAPGRPRRLDAVVVGAGPNGLAAAVVLASAGLSVSVYEAAPGPGGGCRTEELTLPGYSSDVCAAVHPLAAASGFFRRFGLQERGVRLLEPEVGLAHPLDGGRAASAVRSLYETANALGPDAGSYERLLGPLLARSETIVDTVLSPLRSLPAEPAGPVLFARDGLRPATALARRFAGGEAKALVAGLAAHSMRPLQRVGTAAAGLFLGLLLHYVGWPFAEGGSQAIADSMVDALREAGGEVLTASPVRRLEELPPARIVMLDVTPRGLLELAGDRLPAAYQRQLARYRYGPGVCKVDWALSEPVPWTAEVCRRAGTVHVGGELAEIALAESEVASGRHPERPFVLCAQPGTVDGTRAPEGAQVLWTYCHVPSGSERDMSAAIAAQIERFAPGFSDVVVAKSVHSAAACERRNPNYVGGDIASGLQDLRQTFTRPAARWEPYRTPLPGVYLCSSSTPPGPGVHGRCGELAALSALRHELGLRKPPELAPGRG